MALHADETNDGANDDPVTIVATRKAKMDRIGEFEEWMDGIVHEAMKSEGHLGVNIIRPSDPSDQEYVIIFGFSTSENLTKWEMSEAWQAWTKKSLNVAEDEAIVEKKAGLEFWFTPRTVTRSANAPDAASPPRYKMAIIITDVIFVLSSTLLPQIREVTVGLPFLLSTLVGTATMVLLMTYFIMPLMTKLLRPWLLKKKMF